MRKIPANSIGKTSALLLSLKMSSIVLLSDSARALQRRTNISIELYLTPPDLISRTLAAVLSCVFLWKFNDELNCLIEPILFAEKCLGQQQRSREQCHHRLSGEREFLRFSFLLSSSASGGLDLASSGLRSRLDAAGAEK